jgi:nucleoside-diphosphate-sugar epimerase
LGSHVTDALIRQGESVFVVDNLSSGRLSHLEAALASGRATFTFGDVADPTAGWVSDLPVGGNVKLTAVFHFATRGDLDEPGTITCINLALAVHAPLVVVHRHCSADRYEDSAIARAVRNRGLDARVVRFDHAFGPRMSDNDGQLVPGLIKAALKGMPLLTFYDGSKRTHALIYVSDAVNMIVRASVSSPVSADSAKITAEQEWELREIADVVMRVADIDPRPHGMPALGLPELNAFEAGMAKTVAWFRDGRLAYI